MKKHTENCQYDKERKVKSRKQQDIVACFSLILLAVLPECDQAGEGCDQRAYAANIDTQQELFVVIRKLGQ